MSSGLISIGLSGLNAAQTALATTSNNISNVNTPGYTRQQVLQSNASAQFTGSGFVGQGVSVDTVQRIYGSYLVNDLQQTTGASSQATTASTQIQQIDDLLGNSKTGLAPTLDSFFSSLQDLSAHPADAATRQVALSGAQSLATTFNDVDNRLAEMASSNDRQIRDNVTQINTLAGQIAGLNGRIAGAQGAAGVGQAPNDLLDRRDQLLTQLNTYIGATAVPQSNGSVSVMIGNGQALVTGTQASALSAVGSAQDPSRLELSLAAGGSGSAASVRIPAQIVTGGSIAGLFSFRDQALAPARNAVGQLALGVAAAVNGQNALGLDLGGQPGAAIFSSPQPTITAASTNSGGAGLTATIADPASVTASDYRVSFDGSQYSVTRLSDLAVQNFSGMPQTVDGVRLALSGTMAAGDSFHVAPTLHAAGDLRVSATSGSQWATAAPVRADLGTSNQGSLAVDSIAVSGSTLNPAATQTVSLQFHVSGGNTTYDVLDNSGSAVSAANVYTAGTPVSQNGWSLSLSGAPADGDRVSVKANTSGSGDNRNALLLAGLQSANTVAGQSASGVLSTLVASIGAKTQDWKAGADAQTAMLASAQTSRDSVSGVNLDEEAANLLRYQQAYQAASKTIATANTLFDSVLALFH